MHDLGTNMLFRAFCALADGTASVDQLVACSTSRDEYEEHVRLGRCPLAAEHAPVGEVRA